MGASTVVVAAHLFVERFQRPPLSPDPDRLPAHIVRLTPLGAALRVELDAGALGPLRAELDRERAEALGLRVGEPVSLGLRRARVFPDVARVAA